MRLLAAIPYRTLRSVSIGPLELHTFGILVALGIVLGRAVTMRALRGRGLDLGALDKVIAKSVLAGIVGARLAWVATHLAEIHGPVDVIAVWDGGLQFSGGFLVAVAVAAPWVRRLPRLQRAEVADAAAIGLAAGLAIGRLGCMAVGEHLGGPTSFFLGTRYLGGEVIEGPLTIGVTYHNTSFYELLHLLLFTSLVAMARRLDWARVGDGKITIAFLAWYGVWRFVTDLTRSADAAVLGLSGAQWVSVLVLLPAAVVLLARRLRAGRPVRAQRVHHP